VFISIIFSIDADIVTLTFNRKFVSLKMSIWKETLFHNSSRNSQQISSVDKDLLFQRFHLLVNNSSRYIRLIFLKIRIICMFWMSFKLVDIKLYFFFNVKSEPTLFFNWNNNVQSKLNWTPYPFAVFDVCVRSWNPDRDCTRLRISVRSKEHLTTVKVNGMFAFCEASWGEKVKWQE